MEDVFTHLGVSVLHQVAFSLFADKTDSEDRYDVHMHTNN